VAWSGAPPGSTHSASLRAGPAHEKLDAAGFAAYGWPADLDDEAILERLLALNIERARRETRTQS
jgi:hypothetical protein